jgi:hypothetical protein
LGPSEFHEILGDSLELLQDSWDWRSRERERERERELCEHVEISDGCAHMCSLTLGQFFVCCYRLCCGDDIREILYK